MIVKNPSKWLNAHLLLKMLETNNWQLFTPNKLKVELL